MMTRGAAAADGFGDSTHDMAGRIDDVAAALQRVQREMQRIRDTAAAAGLQVANAAIQDPGPAPPRSGSAPTGPAAIAEAVQAHEDAVAAQRAHAAQVRAYQTAQVDADDARAAWNAQVREITNTANRVGNKAWWTGIKLGGVLAAGGTIYDISQGKPAGQAIASGAAGFGAALATGAAIGSFGGPVGTAVGAVIGAGVGIFTSGMVDSLWERGLDSAGQAIEDGWHAVTGTAEAIGSGVANAAEWVAGGVEDAWDALF